MHSSSQVRLRFAPSPTGYLHVGGARTALYNWLYARRMQGTFILRIEDTDFERSSEEMVEGILEGLRWLGLDWDEGPVFQRERLALYRAYASRLLESGHAYYCFCDPAELEEKRRLAQQESGGWIYDRTCAGLSPQEGQTRIVTGRPAAIRFRVPPGSTAFTDLIMGQVDVDNAQVEDFVMLRSDGVPTYHLSVVADDIEMRISHVVRGADHISNTPKQVLLYQALGLPVPQFAHLPLILGPDRSRLSKRHGATSVTAYRDLGFLAPALRNFLALLGWSPGDNREILELEEMVEAFSFERVNRSNAVFDSQKLEWFNGQYMSRTPAGELLPQVRRQMRAEGLWSEDFDDGRRSWLLALVDLLKTRTRKIDDLVQASRPFVSDDFPYDEAAVSKHLKIPEVAPLLEKLEALFEALEAWTLESTEEALRGLAEQEKVKAGVVIGALRVALTGQAAAPGIFDVAITLGRERTLARIRKALKRLGGGT